MMRKPTTTIGWPQYQVVNLQDPSYEDKMVAAHQRGRNAARDGVTRAVVNDKARHTMSVDEGDAFLAGYYAELRRMAKR